jgi:hypothetical protein
VIGHVHERHSATELDRSLNITVIGHHVHCQVIALHALLAGFSRYTKKKKDLLLFKEQKSSI